MESEIPCCSTLSTTTTHTNFREEKNDYCKCYHTPKLWMKAEEKRELRSYLLVLHICVKIVSPLIRWRLVVIITVYYYYICD